MSHLGLSRKGGVDTSGLLSDRDLDTLLCPEEGSRPSPASETFKLALKREQALCAEYSSSFFVVNYSDVNCIVNKAATFLSFPIIFIKCAGAGSWEKGAESQSGKLDRGPVFDSITKGAWWTPGLEPERGGRLWFPAQNSRMGVGGGGTTQPVFPSLLSFPPQQTI